MGLLLCLGSSAWADEEYSIVFKSSSADNSTALTSSDPVSYAVSEGENYVAGFTSNCSKVYANCKNGIKMGTGSATGTLEFTIASGYQANIKSIKIVSVKYGTDTGTLSLYNGSDELESGINPGDDYTYTFASPATVSSIKITTSSKRAYISKVILTAGTGGGSTLTNSDLAVTGAPVVLEFDLYNNADAQTVSYTTSSTGAVTVSSSEYVTTSVNGSTITVTPVKVTPAPQTITISQASDGTYAAGSATFTVKVDDSTPTTGSWVLTNLADLAAGDVFVIVGDNGKTYALANDKGTGSAPTAVAVTISGDAISGSVADNIKWNIGGNATDGYTFYPNGDDQTWLYCTNVNNGVRVGTNNDKTFVLESEYLKHNGTSRYVGVYNSQDWRCYTNTTGNIAGQTFAFYKYTDGSSTPNPSISASNVNIAYDATAGEIDYTVKNEVSGGQLTATTPETWLTLGTVGSASVPFTTTANDAAAERSATITLTYTYNSTETVTKNVTVTQAGDPNIVATIAEVRAQGTGSVTTKGVVTSCSGTTAYIQDATAAICVYGEALTVGDEVKVEGKLSNYKGLLEITNPTATVLSSGNTTTPEVMTIADINNSTNQGWLVKIENATVSAIDGQNVTITQGSNSIVVRFNDTNDITFAVDDVISLTGNIGCYNTAQIANPTIVVTAVPSITINPATYKMDAKAGDGELPVVCTNLAADPKLAVVFCDANGDAVADDTYDWITATINTDGNIDGQITANTGAERTAYFKVRGVDADNNYVYSNLVTFTQSGPSVSIKADKSPYLNPWEVAASGDVHTFSIEYGGLTDPDFKVAFYESDGTTAATYDHSWVTANITTEKKLDVNVNSNDGTARSAYLKVYDTVSGLYSGLFTINQAKFEVDYATLPFEFDGGRAAIETTDGLTQEGLDSDYASSPYLKFNGAGDYVILKINERPGKLSFYVKGNGSGSDAWSGTFKVQTSEDGVNYTDLAAYTDLTATAMDKELNNLGENVRYIKWIYTEKVVGNVALGGIKLAQYSTVPLVTVAKTAINVDSKENYEFVDVTYENVLGGNYEFYTDSKATTTTADPDWVKVSFDSENDVTFTIAPNTGDERTAYVKIFSSDINMNPVYSDLITITQEGSGPVVTGQTYTLAATISSGSHYIITNSKTDGEAKAMGEQSSNNRAAVDITISGNVATVPSTAGVKEVVIYGPYGPDNNIYTIVEENEGYLYAASSSSNYLRTEDDLDANGQWTIAIDDTDGFATIKAQGSNTRNCLRYNSGSSIFSCYGSGQQDIYLFEKDADSYYTTEIPIAAACTDGSKYYATFSKDCAIVVPNGMTASEVGIDADNKLVVTDYLPGAIIPANTGVLLKADQAEKYQVILATGGKSVMGTNNRLRPGGVTAEQMNKFDANCLFYRLTMHNGTQLGFWWGAANGDAFDSGVNKAYLAIPKASAANLRGFSFDEDATGIESAELSVKSEEGAIYDLQGRKVTNATRGLYIVNGKKVFIK